MNEIFVEAAKCQQFALLTPYVQHLVTKCNYLQTKKHPCRQSEVGKGETEVAWDLIGLYINR